MSAIITSVFADASPVGIERYGGMYPCTWRGPRGEFWPEFAGPPHTCSQCGRRIVAETSPRRCFRCNRRIVAYRRVAPLLPDSRQTDELQRQGFYPGRGYPIPYFGPAFICGDCYESNRHAPPLPDRD